MQRISIVVVQIIVIPTMIYAGECAGLSDLVDEAVNLMTAGQTDKALELLRAHVGEYQDDVYYWVPRAACEMTMGLLDSDFRAT